VFMLCGLADRDSVKLFGRGAMDGVIEGRFNKALGSVVKSFPDHRAVTELGCAKRDIGSHSNRKGSTTFTLGISACISVIAVYLRAGWSTGKVQDKYIKTCGAGDQTVGRAVCGSMILDLQYCLLT